MKNEKESDYTVYIKSLFSHRRALFYDFGMPALRRLRKQVLEFADIKPNSKVLDVATGTGEQALVLPEVGHEVIGVDLSPGILKRARTKVRKELSLKFIEHDATKLPFNSNFFDASFICFGLHDMPYTVELSVLEEMGRVTKDGGKLVICDYTSPKEGFLPWLAHKIEKLYETKFFNDYAARGLENILSVAGFKVLKSKICYGILEVVVIQG